jgi:large subunit ribosomal protein L13
LAPRHLGIQKAITLKTFTPSPATISRRWWVVDARGAVLGRLASQVAHILKGKHKPSYAPHMDTGDFVIVVNAAQVRLTSDKAARTFHYRHSGYPGGLRRKSAEELLATRPEEAVRRAVKGMLPHNRLGAVMLSKLKVHAGPEHPHAAQQPMALELPHTLRRLESS